MIRIVIVSQSPAQWEQIQTALRYHRDFTLVGCGKDDYAGLRLIEQERPDIALLDTALPFSTAPDLIPSIRRRSPLTKTIVLRNPQEEDLVLRAISRGAAGHLPKQVDGAVYAAGIRFVEGGGSLMSPELIAKAFTRYPPRGITRQVEARAAYEPPLELKERWIIAFVGLGLSNEAIGEQLHLATGTVRNRVSALLRKRGLRNRTELAVYALNTALVNDRILRRAQERVDQRRREKAEAAAEASAEAVAECRG
jgi:DNA-binding NarL/FixJ family response regulator